jgi:predicted molibdopterin-dependent oxidoreductase YjgC
MSIVTEGLVDEPSCANAATGRVRGLGALHRPNREQPRRRSEAITGVPAGIRAAARLYATGGNAAIYYGLGVTEHSQGSTMVMASPTSPWPPAISAGRRRREPAARPEQRAGLLRHGLLPA